MSRPRTRIVPRRARASRALAVAVLLAAPATAAAQAHPHGRDTAAARTTPAARGVPGIPSSLREEHAELHARLVSATRMAGRVGEAARAVAAVLDPHFVREEQIALPPLGLLRALADGRRPPDMSAVLPLTDSLTAELPRMLAEHVRIAAAVDRMGRAAREARQPAIARLAAEIRLHARTEEEVLYPAAVLVGDLVRARR